MREYNGKADLVAFDLGNVLIHFDHTIAARRLAEMSGLSLSVLIARFRESGLGELFDEGKLTSEAFIQALMLKLGFRVDRSTFENAWNDIFWENPGMLELLKELKPRFPLYVVSDTNELHFRFLREHFPILQMIDSFVLSYEVGARKPEQKVFNEVLKRSGKTADRVIFIDDRLEVAEGARKFGFQAIHFRSLPQLKESLRKLGIEVAGGG